MFQFGHKPSLSFQLTTITIVHFPCRHNTHIYSPVLLQRTFGHFPPTRPSWSGDGLSATKAALQRSVNDWHTPEEWWPAPQSCDPQKGCSPTGGYCYDCRRQFNAQASLKPTADSSSLFFSRHFWAHYWVSVIHLLPNTALVSPALKRKNRKCEMEAAGLDGWFLIHPYKCASGYMQVSAEEDVSAVKNMQT